MLVWLYGLWLFGRIMRPPIRLGWLGASLAAHALAFGLVVRRAPPTADAETPARAPVLAGDTLEVPGLEALAEESAVDLDSEPTPTARATEAATEPKAPLRRAPKLIVHGAPSPAGGDGKASDAEPARFGAVGERSAVDLATAFTRGFPQAASADPVWHHAPFGPAGAIDVVLALDEDGRLASARLEPGGTPALRQALARTIALIRGRTFTAKRETTRLRVVGHVSADAVRDDAHGGDVVFAIGGSFVGRSGSAFFSLSSGRRVDVTVTER